MEGMARRHCSYRQQPKRRCVVVDDDKNSSRTLFASPRSVGSTTSASTKPRLGSSSFLRIGNQHTATGTFAAAISPTSSAAARKRGLFNMPTSSTPLLGPGESPSKKSRRRPSFRPLLFKKHLSTGDTSSSSTSSKRKSLSKTIQSPLKNASSRLASMSSKVKRGRSKKPSFSSPTPQTQPDLHLQTSLDPTECSRFDSICAAVAESSGSLASLGVRCGVQDEANSAQFTSLEPEDHFNGNTRLTPLTFDEDEVASPNHFRSSSAVKGDSSLSTNLDESAVTDEARGPPPVEDDFSLINVLSPAPSLDYNVQQEASPPDEAYIRFLDFLDDQESVDCSIPSLSRNVSIHSSAAVHEDVKVTSSMPPSSSCLTIPSIISTEDEVCDDQGSEDFFDSIANPATQDPAKADKAADSAIVWGALGMILGSPAPASVMLGEKKLRKRTPVNLWQDNDDEAMAEDLDGIISLATDDGQQVDFIAEEEPDQDVSDNCSIPSVSPEMQLEFCKDLVPDVDNSIGNFVLSTPRSSVKDSADTTLAWTALAAILGSPAPTSVARKSITKERVNLWEDGEEPDQLPEIEECDGEINLSELEDLHDIDTCVDEQKAPSNESADSVIAWSALGMLLGSPAPQSVSKKRQQSRKAAASLWEDIEEDIIPDLDNEEEVDDIIPDLDNEEEVDGIPSPLSEEYLDDCVIPDVELEPAEALLLAGTDKREGADSVLAWGALGALLGSPAPTAIIGSKKQVRRSVKNLWDDGDTTEEDLDNLLSDDANIMPSLSGTSDEEDDDTHSIPSLSGTSDESDDQSSRSPPRLGGSYNEWIPSSPQKDAGRKSLTDSTLAWTALAALLGSPAPQAVSPKRKKVQSDLFVHSTTKAEDSLPCIVKSPSVKSIIEVWEGM